ncbi:MAG: hypothetical protein QOF97_1029 [Acidimicrobiaceae bacterium]
MPLPREAARCPSCGHESGSWVGTGARTSDHDLPVGTTSGPRRQLLVAGAAVLGLVAVLVMVDGGSSDPSARPAPATTTSRATTTTVPPVTTARGTTTSTSTTLPPLLLGEPSGVKLLVLADRASLVVDLDTGAVSAPPAVAHGFALARTGGIVLTGPGPAGATFLAAPYDGDPVTIADMPVGQVIASAAEDRVWLIGPTGPPFTITEISVAGDVITPTFDLPGDGYVAGAVERGLVIAAHGSIYVTRGAGDLKSLGAGEVVGTSGRYVAAISCDPTARCPLTIIDTVSGVRQQIIGPPDYGQAVFSPDRSVVAFVATRNAGLGELWLIDRATGVGAKASIPSFTFSGSQQVFSPDSRWLFLPNGRSVSAIRVSDSTVVEIPLDARTSQINQVVVLP